MSPYQYLNIFLFETRTSHRRRLARTKRGKRISGSNFLTAFHSNYGSILRSFSDMTTRRTRDGQTHDNEFTKWQYPAMTCSSGIITLNSPGDSTLQCGRCLWNDMPLNSPKRPSYWNSTSGFDFDHIIAVTCHSAPVCKILSKSDHTQQKKMTSCRFSRWISAILDFRGAIIGH